MVEKFVCCVEKLICWDEILKNEPENVLIGLGNNLCEVGILEVLEIISVVVTVIINSRQKKWKWEIILCR